MIRVKIKETAQANGLQSAYALQRALQMSPTIAARLWRGDFDKIGMNTIDKLCEFFNCQPQNLFEYVTQPGNTTLSSKSEVETFTDLSNNEVITELSNDEIEVVTELSNTVENDKPSGEREPDNETQSASAASDQSDAPAAAASDAVIQNDEALPPPDSEVWITTTEAAKILQVSPRRVRAMVSEGKLTATKDSRFNLVAKSEVENFAATRKNK